MCTNNPEIQTSTGPRTIDNLGQTLNVLSVPRYTELADQVIGRAGWHTGELKLLPSVVLSDLGLCS